MTPFVVLLDMSIDIWTFLCYYCKPSTGTWIAQLPESYFTDILV